MHDIMVVQFQRRYGLTKAQPQAVKEVNLVGGEIWGVGTKNFVNLIAVG